MKSAGTGKSTMPDEAQADGQGPGTPPDRIHNLVLFTTALALLAAWSVYKGLKHPEHRTHDLLWAVLWLLYAVSAWVHKPKGGRLASKPNSSFRLRTIVAFSLVLGFIAFDYAIDSRRQTAAEALAQRTEAWKQSVARRREAFELAKKQVSDYEMKWTAATDAMTKAAVQVKRPDGEIEHAFDPQAFRKWKEALDESQAAMRRHRAEMDRLHRLLLGEPGRYGRP